MFIQSIKAYTQALALDPESLPYVFYRTYPKCGLCLTEVSVYLDKVLKTLYVFSRIELCPFFKDFRPSFSFCQIDVQFPHFKRVTQAPEHVQLKKKGEDKPVKV